MRSVWVFLTGVKLRHGWQEICAVYLQLLLVKTPTEFPESRYGSIGAEERKGKRSLISMLYEIEHTNDYIEPLMIAEISIL